MKRLLISSTCFSMVLTSIPVPLMAQTTLQIGEQEVICLPNKKMDCPEGAFCVVARRERNCEARAMEALGLATPGEAEAEAEVEGEVTEAPAEDPAAAPADAPADDGAEAAALAEALAAEEAAATLAADEAAAAEAQVAADAAVLAAEEAAAAAALAAEQDAVAQAEADAAAALVAEEAAAAAAQAAADAQAAAESEAVVVDPAPAPEAAVDPVVTAEDAPVEVAPMTEAEASAVLETAEGIDAPTAEAVDALTGILTADPSVETISDAPPVAAAAAAEEEAAATVATEAGEAAPKPDRKRRKPRATVVEVTEADTRDSSEDFAESAIATQTARDDDGGKSLSNLEKFGLVVVGALVVGAILKNGDRVVSNSGDRVVVEQPDGRYVVLKDDDTLIRTPGSTVQTETYDDGSTRSSVLYADGSRVVTIRDAAGRVLRRSRFDSAGREVRLIDDLAPVDRIDVTTLPRPRDGGVVISTRSQDAELRAAMLAMERDTIGRAFSLRQIREYPQVRALAPALDVASLTFDTGSAAIRATEARKLAELGRVMADMVRENPAEMFLIEGHTDAVGSGAYNLALSDRRAESLALALSEYFAVPPENMVVQGYGETELRINTAGDEPLNRRTAVRVLSPLLLRTAQN